MTIEQTIEKPTFQTDKVTVIAIGHGVQDTYQSFLPALLPLLIEKFSLIKTEAGLLSVFANAPSLLQPLIGYLADHAGPRYFVIFSPAITGITMSLLGIAPTYGVAAMLLLITGLSSASIHATGPVMVGRLSAHRLGLGMSFWMVAGELGRVIGPLTIVTVVQYFSIEKTPWLSIFGILTSIFLYIQLRGVNGQSVQMSKAPPWREALKGMGKVLLPVTGIVITRGFAWVSVTTFLPTYLTEQGANLVLAGASLSIMQAAGAVGAFFGGSLSDRVGRKPMMIMALVVTSTTLFAFTSLDGWILFPLLLLLGFSLLSITPILMAVVQESYPESRALANGVYMAVSFVGGSLVTVLVGAMGDLTSLRTAYFVSAGLALLALPFVLRLPKTNGH
ncbi:MAG: MFS transporter [Bellilinea sp.]